MPKEKWQRTYSKKRSVNLPYRRPPPSDGLTPAESILAQTPQMWISEFADHRRTIRELPEEEREMRNLELTLALGTAAQKKEKEEEVTPLRYGLCSRDVAESYPIICGATGSSAGERLSAPVGTYFEWLMRTANEAINKVHEMQSPARAPTAKQAARDWLEAAVEFLTLVMEENAITGRYVAGPARPAPDRPESIVNPYICDSGRDRCRYDSEPGGCKRGNLEHAAQFLHPKARRALLNKMEAAGFPVMEVTETPVEDGFPPGKKQACGVPAAGWCQDKPPGIVGQRVVTVSNTDIVAYIHRSLQEYDREGVDGGRGHAGGTRGTRKRSGARNKRSGTRKKRSGTRNKRRGTRNKRSGTRKKRRGTRGEHRGTHKYLSN